jgi:hypothetical protein
MSEVYTCGVIEESLNDTRILSALSSFLHTSRVENMPDDEAGTWHIYEYHIPEKNLESLIPELQHNIK